MNYDKLSFAQAFAAAHDSGKDEFTWKGKRFKTNRKDGTSTNARKRAVAARSAPKRPTEVSHTYQPKTSHRQAENASPVNYPYPNPNYSRDSELLRAVKTKMMNAHNMARNAVGMDEIFPDAQPGSIGWAHLRSAASNPMARALEGQDLTSGQPPGNYNSMGFGDQLMQYLIRSAGQLGEVGMAATGAYQGGRAIDLANKMRAAENFGLRSKLNPTEYASGMRAEPYLK